MVSLVLVLMFLFIFISSIFFDFIRFGSHDAVELSIFRELIFERDDRIPIKKQPFTFIAVRHEAQLVRADIELLGVDLPVSASLFQHVNEI